MRLLLCLLLACEKTGGVEPTGGSSTHEVTPAKPAPPDAVATLPNDAAVAQVVDAPDPKPKPAPIDDDARAYANMLTADDDSKVTGDMAQRRPGADLAKQIADAKGQPVGNGGGPGALKTGSGASPVDQKGPNGRISVVRKEAFDNTSLTADAVLAKIQSVYMAGMKRCYKSYLSKDESARGKVVVSLTVNQTGRATNAKATGFASEIDSCITGQMGGWRFPVPKDKDGEATDASFAITLQLVPD